jgi:hypothetical protein
MNDWLERMGLDADGCGNCKPEPAPMGRVTILGNMKVRTYLKIAALADTALS